MRRWRSSWACAHASTITTITAGLSREVCESCGRVRVSYVEPVVKLDHDLIGGGESGEWGPTDDDIEVARAFEARVTFEEASRFLTCPLCAQPAVFIIPDGLRCGEHAWQAAARLDWDVVDPWVPIRIDRSIA